MKTSQQCFHQTFFKRCLCHRAHLALHSAGPFRPAASPRHNRRAPVAVSGCDCIRSVRCLLTKCHYAFHRRLNSYLIHPESPLMKSRSSAEFQKRNAKISHPCTISRRQPDPVENLAEKKLSPAICHASQPALAHVKRMYTSKGMMRMAISKSALCIVRLLKCLSCW